MAPRSKQNKKTGVTKESQALSQYIKETAPDEAREFIAEKQLSLMIEICEACCKDRIQCVMRPLCEDRKQLQILISIGAPESLYPQFCYTQYKNSIRRFWEKKSVIHQPLDAVISLKVFLELLIRKKEFHGTTLEKLKGDQIEVAFNEKMSQYAKEIIAHHAEKKTLFSVDGVLYLIDFKKKMVTVNLTKKKISSAKDLDELLKLLSKTYNLKFLLDVKMKGWTYLKIPFQTKISSDPSVLKTKLKELDTEFEYLVESSSKGKTSVVVDLKTAEFPNDPTSTYGEVRDLFQILGEIQSKSDTKLDNTDKGNGE
ncbi:MAG: hypothetical protein ACW976_06155 [Candidatus Ranarchaeia archaeon]